MQSIFGFSPTSTVIYWQLKLFSCLLSANRNKLHTNSLLQDTVLEYSTARLNHLGLAVAIDKL